MTRLEKLQTTVTLKKWIFYDPDVGVLAAHHTGQPGSGKSNMSTGLAAQCVKKNNEYLIMPGDRWCEWKHFLDHNLLKGINLQVIVPDNCPINYYGLSQGENYLIECNYDEINVFDYLDPINRILVIYDSHIHPQDRTYLWLNVLQQLLNRDTLVNTCIGLLYHEASVLFPERSRELKWHDIQEYSQHFVETRKGLIRHQFVSQVEYEIESSIRMKCGIQFLRKGRAGKHHHPEIKASTPFLDIDEYNLVISSGGFKKYNKIKKFYEKKKIMKMIPTRTTYVTREERDTTIKIDEKSNVLIQNCYEFTESIRETSRILGISRERIRKVIKT